METFSVLLAFCAGNLSVTSEFPSQRPVTRSFDVFFDLRVNKRLRWRWRHLAFVSIQFQFTNIYCLINYRIQHSSRNSMQQGSRKHRSYPRQVTERMECNFLIPPPSSMYHKATNAAVCGQWAIKHDCQNDSSLIIFTMRDAVRWIYVTSQNIPRFDKEWKILSIYVFATYIFVHPILTPRKLISGTAEWPQNGFCDRSPWRMGNCNYRRPNMAMRNSNGADNVRQLRRARRKVRCLIQRRWIFSNELDKLERPFWEYPPQ